MATKAAPTLTWTGSTPPQSFAVKIPDTRTNESHATGYPVYTLPLRVAPKLSDWVAGTGTTKYSYPIG